MSSPTRKQPHILFLFSDTGGGHRSATEAIIEAVQIEFADRFSCEMVDIFKDYAPLPLNYMPEFYTQMVRLPRAWGLGYRLSNGHSRARLMTSSAWPYVRRRIRTLVAQHPSDLTVAVHPLANAPVLRALGERRSPFVTVVTDLVTTHALWYHRRSDLCLVPTEIARQRALECGLAQERVQVVGMPVAERFCQPSGDQSALRAQLGWPCDRPVILLVGGGEGMGPLEKTAHAIAAARLPATLVIIAGRNQSLKERLEAHSWSIPTFIYGFVRAMPDFMGAADILVTKAGPGTISEAFIAGLPLILYSHLPGQEDGNIAYVTSQKAGVWAPYPEAIVYALRLWLFFPEQRRLAAAASHRLARPDAARRTARLLVRQLQPVDER